MIFCLISESLLSTRYMAGFVVFISIHYHYHTSTVPLIFTCCLLTTATEATAKYGAFSEAFRRSIAEARMCSMFCGGKNCKYEGTTHWSEDQQAIPGLYSNWYVK